MAKDILQLGWQPYTKYDIMGVCLWSDRFCAKILQQL